MRGSVNVAPLARDIIERRLGWFGHVKNREVLSDAHIPGNIQTGRQYTR